MSSSSSSSLSTALNSTAAMAAFTSTALISIAPNVLLLLFPHYGCGEGQHSFVLSLGQAIAAGGLLGDVFLHVIPHAAGGHHNSASTSNGHDTMGLWILMGFSIFLVTDMVIRQLNQTTNTTHGGHSHGSSSNNNNKSESESSSHQKTIHEHPEHKQSLVLLNLAADALHNFTDGLAIGASFSNYAGKSADNAAGVLEMIQSRGGLATLSILFHEIPHELGDFAILVKEGFSKRQAILAQFGTAVAAMMGTYVGLLTAHVAGDELMFITAGGFVYLATVNILPELLDEGRSWKFRLVQLLFFAMGIGFLYAVSLLEEMDEHSHSGHHSHGHHHHHHHHHHHSRQSPPEEEVVVLEHHHMHHAHHTVDIHETSLHDNHDHSHGHGHHHYDQGEF
ncbi:ZIP zinc transporter [Nitzschia inconspicua]|uniref:ZIP zinc transporter n=1 Tax=Nitzschia inconspicua TaxID=303405 RepID=A0A9K3LSZ1_9STRA|nr:ZIP zinc transporter [Nitzschia inconspicua]